jgi:16S rRNA (cytosine1402-N4)-methyltransferase
MHLGTAPQQVTGHTPVLLHEVLQSLAISAGDTVVDATLGGGGHARELVKALDARGVFVGLDADSAALERTRTALYAAPSAALPTIHLVQSNFRKLDDILVSLGIDGIDKALFDLGWSGYQLSAGRGFSFLADEPLLMTYTDSVQPDTLTALKVVNTWAEESLSDVIYGWGEERASRKIAKAIVDARKRKPIETSRELAEIVESIVPRRGRVHPATRTFQALRIAVNDEFGAIRQALRATWSALRSHGRIAVITFHSIEDREVKQIMREWQKNGEGKLVSKKPIMPTNEEMRENPRARSAKLRVIERL